MLGECLNNVKFLYGKSYGSETLLVKCHTISLLNVRCLKVSEVQGCRKLTQQFKEQALKQMHCVLIY